MLITFLIAAVPSCSFYEDSKLLQVIFIVCMIVSLATHREFGISWLFQLIEKIIGFFYAVNIVLFVYFVLGAGILVSILGCNVSQLLFGWLL